MPKRRNTMITSKYMNYDQVPMFMNAKIVADLLGISPTSVYELMKKRGFPSIRVGNRIVIPRDRFIEWVEKNTSKVR